MPRWGKHKDDVDVGTVGEPEPVTFRPLGDRVLIRPNEAAGDDIDEKSGIVTKLAAHKDEPAEGLIVAAGDGRVTDDGKTLPMMLNVGDLVAYGKYAGTTIMLDGEQFLIMGEKDVLGVIE